MRDRLMGYDPMVYDTLRELATQLGGAYIERKRATMLGGERERWARMSVELGREIRAVDVYDETAVRAKTKDLAERLHALRVV